MCKINDPETFNIEKYEHDSNQILYLEMLKQKQKFNSMKKLMDKQTDLLKLIIKRMEIRTETDCYVDDDDDENGNASQETNNRMRHDQMSRRCSFLRFSKDLGQISSKTRLTGT